MLAFWLTLLFSRMFSFAPACGWGASLGAIVYRRANWQTGAGRRARRVRASIVSLCGRSR